MDQPDVVEAAERVYADLGNRGIAAVIDDSRIAPKDKAPAPPPPGGKAEAGMRICPRCGKPVHLSAIVCRACGAHVPKR